MERQEHYYSVNGIQLHTVETGDSEGKTILFLHGFPEFWYGWKKQLEFFAAQGWRAVAPDQRGYNLSSKPKGTNAYKMHHLTQDIAELIPQISRGKVVLVGHDWGGGVAWNLAMQKPQLLEKLIILNMPHPQVMKRQLSSNPRQMLRSWYTGFFQIPKVPEAVFRLFDYKLLEKSMAGTAHTNAFTLEEMEEYKAAWARPGALESMINWYRAYRRSHVQEDLHIAVPTLMLWGKKDKFLSTELVQPSLQHCLRGEVYFLDNASHWLHHEEPHRVNQLILEFVKR